MKRAATKAVQEDDRMRAEYDFKGGMRGKHHQAMQAGYTITIHKADGRRVIKEVRPKEGAVILEPDVRQLFPDSDSVNATLRSLIQLIPKKLRKAVKNAQTVDARRRLASSNR
jgi:predicted peptidase